MNQISTTTNDNNTKKNVFTISHASAGTQRQQQLQEAMMAPNSNNQQPSLALSSLPSTTNSSAAAACVSCLTPRQDINMKEQNENMSNLRKENLVCANYNDYQVTLTTAYNHRCFVVALVNETFKQRKEALFGYSSSSSSPEMTSMMMMMMESSVESTTSSSSAFTSSTNSSSSSCSFSSSNSSFGGSPANVPRGSPMAAIRRRNRRFNELKNEIAELHQVIYEKYQRAANASVAAIAAQKPTAGKTTSKKTASAASVLAVQDPYREILSLISAKKSFQDMIRM